MFDTLGKTTALCLALLFAVACSDDTENGQKDTGAPDVTVKTCTAKPLLPADNKIGDFTQSKTPESAEDLKKLTALINGGSEKYTQGNKFVCMYRVSYASTTKTYTLELRIFDETDTAGATAAYDNTKNPSDTDISPAIGDAARGHENAVAGIYQADMRKGQYLVRVIASHKDGMTDAHALLTDVASAIK